MKKSELLRIIDQDLLDKLFGFCFSRTASSQEAEELCSDIVFELVKAANSEGEIGTEDDADTALYAFIWRVARNVYADYSEHRHRTVQSAATGDVEAILALLADEDESEAAEREALERDSESLRLIYRRIANLTRAYRTVMIAYYLDGKSVREIAAQLGTAENTVRQRLFSARETIRKEVTTMETTKAQKPVALHHLELALWGNGMPLTGDPRSLIDRQLSRHILWLCRKEEMSAREIAEELNVPMLYIEEELELQTAGVGETKYATLRRLPNGKYITNIPLLSAEEIAQGRAIYAAHTEELCRRIRAYIRKNARKYFCFPYLNHAPTLDLILWHHFPVLATKVGDMVEELLQQKYFADVTPAKRPFSLRGFEVVDEATRYMGWDGIMAHNICGYRRVGVDNIYTEKLKAHFHCGHDLANDVPLQLAIRAIDGLPVNELTEDEREQAARAIKRGYLMREGDTLYTKILVMTNADAERVFLIDSDLRDDIRPIAEEIAEQTAAWLRATLPAHLLPEYTLIAQIALGNVVSDICDDLIRHGLLYLPEEEYGAEGCWMTVEGERGHWLLVDDPAEIGTKAPTEADIPLPEATADDGDGTSPI